MISKLRLYRATLWAILLIMAAKGPLSAVVFKKERKPSTAAASSGPAMMPDHILVKFKSRAKASVRTRMLSEMKMVAQSEIEPLGIHIVTISSTTIPTEAIARLKSLYGSDIEYAEPNYVRTPMSTPNDPLLSQQWQLSHAELPEAWNTNTGSGIILAVADTGFQPTHPDLASGLLSGYSTLDGTANTPDEYGHGTGVAGMAAAPGNNGIGVAGAAYSASIYPIKIADVTGLTTDSRIITAINRAADRGARVINISFGSDFPAPLGCWPTSVTDACRYMRSKNGLVVFSAGNANIDKGCPHDSSFVNVAATDIGDTKASFSNYGDAIDIAAPGDSVYTTNCDACFGLGPFGPAQYDFVSGTSYASPFTAGILALIYAVDPAFTSDQAQQILFDSATDLGAPGRDAIYGYGLVNAKNALGLAQQRSVLFRLLSLANVYAYPNPWDTRKHSNKQVTLANVPDDASVKLFTLSGFFVKSLQPANGRAVWDLTNSAGDAVASGLYFYLVQTADGSHKARGRIALIR